MNVGIAFKTPEEVWNGQSKDANATALYPLLFDPKEFKEALARSSISSPLPPALKELSLQKKSPMLVLMVGFPACEWSSEPN